MRSRHVCYPYSLLELMGGEAGGFGSGLSTFREGARLNVLVRPALRLDELP
jgi:hypothetical protein